MIWIVKKVVGRWVKRKEPPKEIICLSCLTTQSTSKIIDNDNACVVCDCKIDPFNLSDIEV